MLEPRLPDAYMNTKGNTEAVLEEFRSVASSAGMQLIEYQTPERMGTWIMAFRPMFEVDQEEPCLCLIADLAEPRTIWLEAAARWVPDPPDHDHYVALMKAMADPLLREHRRAYGRRTHLRVEAKTSVPRRLPPRAASLLRAFTVTANRKSLHKSDWVRFYRFILHCSSHRILLTEEDIARHLLVGGFSEPMAMSIAAVGRHCLAISRLRRTPLGAPL